MAHNPATVLKTRNYQRSLSVFGASGKVDRSRIQVDGKTFEAIDNCLRVGCRYYSARAQHFHMSDTSDDIVTPKSTVEAEAGVELVDERIGLLRKTTRP